MRLLCLLIIAAVMVQVSSLRVCAMQTMAMGWNCHDDDASAVAAAAAAMPNGCAGHPDGSADEDCVCEQPEISIRTAADDTAGHLLPPPVATSVIILHPSMFPPPPAAQPDTAPPPPQRILPLLI